VLGNGYRVTNIRATCGECGGDLLSTNIRGEAEIAGKGVRIRAVALCRPCRAYTYVSHLILPSLSGGVHVHQPADYPPKVPWSEDIADAAKLRSVCDADLSQERWWVDLMDKLAAA
jgi:hypothetical protein